MNGLLDISKFKSLSTVLLGLLSIAPAFLYGQVVSDEAKALAAWMEEYSNLPAAPGEDELPTYKPAWFDEIEIRSETDEFKLNQQRYTLRAEPRLPHVRSAERRIQNAQRAGLNGLSENVLSDGRADALNQLFELSTDLREAALLDTLFDVQSRLVDVTRFRVVEPNYDVEKVLDAEDELAEISLRLMELRSSSDQLKPPVRSRDLVQVEDIRFRLLSIVSEGPATTEDQAATLERIDAEMALERAENLSFIKFLQVEYRSSNDPDDMTRDQLSVGGSISFPKRERRIRKLDELKVDRLEERYDFELKQLERKRKFKEAVSAVQQKFKLYDEMKKQLVVRRERRDRLANTYLQSSTARPESLLRLSRRNLNEKLDLLQLEEDIREGYAALLGDFLTLDEAGIQRWVLK
jgi:hypothetical protein